LVSIKDNIRKEIREAVLLLIFWYKLQELWGLILVGGC